MNYIIISTICLVLTNFFGAFEVPRIIVFTTLLGFTAMSFSHKSIFRNVIVFVFLGLFASMISSNVFRGQSYLDSIKASYYYFNLLLYFVFLYYRPSIKEVEKSIFLLTILFIGAYLLQYILYPLVIFEGANREFFNDEVRIRLTGQGIISLGYFYSLNQFLRKSQFRWLYLLVLSACVVVIFLMGFRTMLAAVFIFTFILIIKIQGVSTRLVVQSATIIVVGLLLMQIPVLSRVLDNMQERQKSDNFSNSDYARVLQWDYYTTSHFKSTSEFFFGSGNPYRPFADSGTGGSSYGKQMETLVEMHLNWVDLGLISTSWIVGILTVLALIFLAIMASRQRLLKRYQYLSIWYLYMLAVSFTTIEFVRPGNFEIQALVLYAIVVAKYRTNAIIKLKKEKKYENRNINVSSFS